MLNTAACGREVVDRVVQVGDGGLKTVLDGPQVAAQTINLVACCINLSQQFILTGVARGEVNASDITITILSYRGARNFIAWGVGGITVAVFSYFNRKYLALFVCSVVIAIIFEDGDRKSTRLNSSHVAISYA